jgi:hypothetical protein
VCVYVDFIAQCREAVSVMTESFEGLQERYVVHFEAAPTQINPLRGIFW